MADLVYRWNRERGVWGVFRTGEFAGYVTSFPSLSEVEAYVAANSDTCERCGQ